MAKKLKKFDDFVNETNIKTKLNSDDEQFVLNWFQEAFGPNKDTTDGYYAEWLHRFEKSFTAFLNHMGGDAQRAFIKTVEKYFKGR